LSLLFFVLGGCGGGNNVPSAGDLDEHVIVHPVPTDGGRGCSISTRRPKQLRLDRLEVALWWHHLSG
jgi:hypothetical protein